VRGCSKILLQSELGLNGGICVEDMARIKILSNILREEAPQLLISNSELIPQLREKLEVICCGKAPEVGEAHGGKNTVMPKPH